MSEQPTDYGKELIEAVARGIYECAPLTNMDEPIAWEGLTEYVREGDRHIARAALLAACARIAALTRLVEQFIVEIEAPSFDNQRAAADRCDLVQRARAALAEPGPSAWTSGNSG